MKKISVFLVLLVVLGIFSIAMVNYNLSLGKRVVIDQVQFVKQYSGVVNVTTPTVVGIMFFDSSYNLYVTTGTSRLNDYKKLNP